ncbi:MAG: AAA-like domain protein [Promethearchaeota archaeon]|nr:MAG: AAA-like domain protein [Candidatus Lokiarchaeota archaeon]
MKLGTILNYNHLPDVSKFPFVINKRKDGKLVKKGLFVSTETLEGLLIGVVERILLLNEYFTDALTIQSYNTNNNPNILKGLFPSDEFEFAIAITRCMGLIEFKDDKEKEISKIIRMTFPATPGSEVHLVEKDLLNKFLGFEQKNGLNLGKLKVMNLDARINLDRLLNKHFAILSISGGGKSYLTSVIIEEILNRNKEFGTPALILIDVHGEYTYLNDIPQLKDKISIQDISYFQLAVPKLNAWKFKKYQDRISYVQVRELSKYIRALRTKKTKKNLYSLDDIIDLIEEDEEGNKSTKQALIGWLSELQKLMIFGSQENPIMKNIVNPQKLTIFNFQKEINIRKKQIILDYIASRLFYLRRMNRIPPFLLIVEESHQFCPEAAQSKALSKSIIETIAREGRKFMACLCLISQRPKKLSTTALSQMNSKMILNIKNPYDLKHLMESSESITKESSDLISSLGVGEMLLMGNAINYPVFIDVRTRKYDVKSNDKSLSEQCLKWQQNKIN